MHADDWQSSVVCSIRFAVDADQSYYKHLATSLPPTQTRRGVCPGQFPRPDGTTLASMQLLTLCEETPCNETTWDGAPPSVMDFLFHRPFYLAHLLEAAVLQPIREAPVHDITLVTVFSMPR